MRDARIFGAAALLLALCVADGPAGGQTPPPPGGRRGPGGGRDHRGPGGSNYFNLAFPAQPLDFLLARPEARSMTLSVQSAAALEGYATWGTNTPADTGRSPVRRFAAGSPAEIEMTGLRPDHGYQYEFWSRAVDAESAAPFTNAPAGAFHTARASGAAFTFTLTADAHLDEHTSPGVYQRTLANVRADGPDFHLDLGNLFMTDKHADRDSAARHYAAERYYLSRIGDRVPVLLALGVHDGESARDDDGSPNSLAAWSRGQRTRYFPNPVPDTFYTGNTQLLPGGGHYQNYFAFEWGDARFVVLDPFRYSVRQRGGSDGWAWSLGREQYDWLARSLSGSKARFKFVFLHNLLSGDQASRGGVEIAGFNEWGGRNRDGTPGFAEHRPGWPAPVHELLRRHGVTVVFKAHDNFFAHQELDGIVYEMVPQPSFAGDTRVRDRENYGYQVGDLLGNSGYVRVRVGPAAAELDYVQTPQRGSAPPTVAHHAVVSARSGSR